MECPLVGSRYTATLVLVQCITISDVLKFMISQPKRAIRDRQRKMNESIQSQSEIHSSLQSTMSSATRFKLIFFTPFSALSTCKSAIFAAGAGRYPLTPKIHTASSLPNTESSSTYTECCFTTIGTGQFRPGDGANPHIGKVGQLEEVQEARVEIVCVGEDVTRRVVEALKK